MFYLSEDDTRLLAILEATGTITNRSKWLAQHLNSEGEKAGVRIVLKQAIERKKAELAQLEHLDIECEKIELDTQLLQAKLLKQFWARYGVFGKAPTRQQNIWWLEGRKKVLHLLYGKKPLSEVLDLIEQEGNKG